MSETRNTPLHPPWRPWTLVVLQVTGDLQEMAVADLYNLQAYADLIRRAGFTVNSVEDLTGDWGVISKQRLAMYRKLREETQAAGTPAGHDAFYKNYVRFVDLVNDAGLGGGRFVGERPG